MTKAQIKIYPLAKIKKIYLPKRSNGDTTNCQRS